MQETGNSAGNGLRNMQQRMQQVGGQMVLLNGEGTTIEFTIPLK
jgi:signal transduction histidine kinase